MTELLPCPFRGGEIRIVRLHGSYGEPWYARCDRCEVSSYYYKTEAQAIEAWSDWPERTCKVVWRENGWGTRTRHCGACGADLDCDTRNRQNYCPNCGARVMEEVDADGQG